MLNTRNILESTEENHQELNKEPYKPVSPEVMQIKYICNPTSTEINPSINANDFITTSSTAKINQSLCSKGKNFFWFRNAARNNPNFFPDSITNMPAAEIRELIKTNPQGRKIYSKLKNSEEKSQEPKKNKDAKRKKTAEPKEPEESKPRKREKWDPFNNYSTSSSFFEIFNGKTTRKEINEGKKLLNSMGINKVKDLVNFNGKNMRRI